MIDKFYEWIDGTYDNREQAYMFPTLYSHVILTHCLLPNGLIYGEQKNISMGGRIYRQFVVKPTLDGDNIVVKNYNIDKKLFLGFNNLDLIDEDKLDHKIGCDTVFEYDKLAREYIGRIRGCNCIVVFDGSETFVKNNARLGEDHYWVYDKGYSVKTKKQIWGSNDKHYRFKKIDKGYLWKGG
jgi:hypothetical protein